MKARVKVHFISLGLTNNYWNFAFNHCVCLHSYLPRAGNKYLFKASREVAGQLMLILCMAGKCLVIVSSPVTDWRQGIQAEFSGYHKTDINAFIFDDRCHRILRISAQKPVKSIFPVKAARNPSSGTLEHPVIGGDDGGGGYLFSGGSVVDNIGDHDQGVKDTNMSSAHLPSDATISEGGNGKPRDRLSGLELTAQNSEANRDSGGLSGLELIDHDTDNHDDDHAKASLPAGVPKDAERLVVKAEEPTTLGACGSAESKLFRRGARNSNIDSDAVPTNVSQSDPHKKLITPVKQEIKQLRAAYNALVKPGLILDTKTFHI